MTDHEGKRKIFLARGIKLGLETTIFIARDEGYDNFFQARLNSKNKTDFLLSEVIFLLHYAFCVLNWTDTKS